MTTIVNEKQKMGLLQPSYFKQIAGQQIAFYESKGTGETVLMVHGNSSNSGNFKNQLLSELGEKHHLVAFDFPGCGNSPFSSDPKNSYSFVSLTNLLLEIIQSLTSPCLLIGHSLGANVALFAAQKKPTQIKGLFLSGLLLVDTAVDLAQAALPNPALSLFYQENLSEQERNIIAKAGLCHPTPENIEFVSNGFKITDPLLRTGIAASIADLGLFIGHREFLRANLLPVSLVEGSHDAFINREYLEKQEIKALWRKKVQVVENAGHYLYFENPVAINLLLEQFISQYS